MAKKQKPQDDQGEMKYLWKYFEFHANQRITLFKYYIIFISAYFYGTGYLVINFPSNSDIHEIALIGISVFIIIVTCIFRRLDNRNRQLVKYAEDYIVDYEKGVKGYLKIFSKERDDANEIKEKVEERLEKCKIYENLERCKYKKFSSQEYMADFFHHRHTTIFHSLYTIVYIIAGLCIIISTGSMLS